MSEAWSGRACPGTRWRSRSTTEGTWLSLIGRVRERSSAIIRRCSDSPWRCSWFRPASTASRCPSRWHCRAPAGPTPRSAPSSASRRSFRCRPRSLGGALIDRFGGMRLFALGGVLYLASCGIAAAARSGSGKLDRWPFVAARVLQGFGFGMSCPGRARRRAAPRPLCATRRRPGHDERCRTT